MLWFLHCLELWYFPQGITAPPQWTRASSLRTLHDYTQTHHIRWDSSGRVISPTQLPLLDNTQHSKQTDIHASGWIRTHNLRRRAAAHLRLRPRDRWYQQYQHHSRRISQEHNCVPVQKWAYKCLKWLTKERKRFFDVIKYFVTHHAPRDLSFLWTCLCVAVSL